MPHGPCAFWVELLGSKYSQVLCCRGSVLDRAAFVGLDRQKGAGGQLEIYFMIGQSKGRRQHCCFGIVWPGVLSVCDAPSPPCVFAI